MEPSNQRSPFHQAGFSLVEIMVGLTIGMFATLVIMQVFSVFETQKRTTTGTANAQTNGGIALYNIGRELKFAGYPLMPVTNSPLECTTLTVNGTADATVPNRLSPVAIADNVAASGVSASDRITLRYGNSTMGGIPAKICNVAGATITADNNPACVGNNFGCQVGDNTLVISKDGTTCAMSSVPLGGVTGTTTVTLANATGAVNDAYLACLGTWNEITYAVNNGNLERNGIPTVSGIVNLQAQYGISASTDSNQIIQWVNASAATGWNAPIVSAVKTAPFHRNRIKAVRIAVVARNAKKEAKVANACVTTTACSSITAAAPTGLCAWAGNALSPAPAIDLSAGDADWGCYRYRVFETIIPLRNMIWSNSTL